MSKRWVACSALLICTAVMHTDMTSVDRNFLTSAVTVNEEEVAAAESQTHSTNAEVQVYARNALKLYHKANGQLKALALQYNIAVPQALPVPPAVPAQQYLRDEAQRQEKAISLYRDEIKGGSNTSLRQYAIEYLPMIESSLSHSRVLHVSVVLCTSG